MNPRKPTLFVLLVSSVLWALAGGLLPPTTHAQETAPPLERPAERPSRAAEAQAKKEKETAEEAAARKAAEEKALIDKVAGPPAIEDQLPEEPLDVDREVTSALFDGAAGLIPPPVTPPPARPPGAAPAPAEEPAHPAVKGPRVRFQLSGAEAWAAASREGWKFFPRGSQGPRDGRMTTARTLPGAVTSLVNGATMTQFRTPIGTAARSENVFYMFADEKANAKRLAPGWTVRDLRLDGSAFRWISKPAAGSNSPSFAIFLSGQLEPFDLTVSVTSLVLEGPPGATDWREAFQAERKPER